MKIYDAADFGRAVRTFRKAKGYTQQQIADLSGCSLMFVSNLERGKGLIEAGHRGRIRRGFIPSLLLPWSWVLAKIRDSRPSNGQILLNWGIPWD